MNMPVDEIKTIEYIIYTTKDQDKATKGAEELEDAMEELM